MVRLHDRNSAIAGLSDLYHRADYCLCDSKILALLAKWRGVDLPVIPGSDLTARIFTDVLNPGDRIAIIGGDESTPIQLTARYPSIEIVQHIPPMGLLKNATARQAAAAFIAGQKPRFTFVCVGSPQQELIAAEAAENPGARGLALCVGASLDFLTDRQKRAPSIVRQMKLEWAHRLLTNPRRLWRRYLVEGPAIFVLAYRWRKSAA